MRLIIKITILFVAVMLFLAPTAVTIFARPSGTGTGEDRKHARPFVEHILIGHSFALNGDQYHILDVNAIKMSNLPPSFIRSLFSQNRTEKKQ